MDCPDNAFCRSSSYCVCKDGFVYAAVNSTHKGCLKGKTLIMSKPLSKLKKCKKVRGVSYRNRLKNRKHSCPSVLRNLLVSAWKRGTLNTFVKIDITFILKSTPHTYYNRREDRQCAFLCLLLLKTQKDKLILQHIAYFFQKKGRVIEGWKGIELNLLLD